MQKINLSWEMALLSKFQNYSLKHKLTQSPFTPVVAKLLAGDHLLMISPTDVHLVDGLKASQQLLLYCIWCNVTRWKSFQLNLDTKTKLKT